MKNIYDVFESYGFQHMEDDPNVMIKFIDGGRRAQLVVDCDEENHYTIWLYTPLRKNGGSVRFDGFITTVEFAKMLLDNLKLESWL